MARQVSDTQKGETTRLRILDAAETLFAEAGFEGASTRRIAEMAGVPAGLINYHFGSKEDLYRAVFERRAVTVVDQRMAGLRIARLERDPDRRVELIVRAMLVPMFAMRASTKRAMFGMLLVREVTDPRSHDRGIIQEMFDPVAHEVLAALDGCFPDWTKAELHWAYQTMLGAMCQVISDAGRIERLSDGACSPEDTEAAAAQVGAILVAGFRFRDRSTAFAAAREV